MEDSQNKIKDKGWLFYYGYPLAFLILTIAGFSYSTYLDYQKSQNQDKIIQDTQLSLEQEREGKIACIYLADSLHKTIQSYSPYKDLVSSMAQRDAAIKDLKYKVGDQAHLKSDSTRIIIEDIITGGSQYEYYVRYKVISKDKEQEVKPELIY